MRSGSPVGLEKTRELVFVHLPPTIRSLVHAAGVRALRPGGVLITEAFTPLQPGRPSGGPRQAELLYEVATLRADFPGVDWQVLEETEIELDEGPFHGGTAAVVRGVGKARPSRGHVDPES